MAESFKIVGPNTIQTYITSEKVAIPVQVEFKEGNQTITKQIPRIGSDICNPHLTPFIKLP